MCALKYFKRGSLIKRRRKVKSYGMYLRAAGIALMVLAISSCFFGGTNSGIVLPELIDKPQLPPAPPNIQSSDFYIRSSLAIGTNGSVSWASLLNPITDRRWDSAAVTTMRRWVYSPAVYKGKRIPLRIIQVARVEYMRPVMLKVSQMVFVRISRADSVYRLLERGANFDSLASTLSPPISSLKMGRLGRIDVLRFPEEIRTELESLATNDFTSPLPLGSFFAIFRRD